MCETMASVPIEENSYVLTEDMFDAAMTEQFAYQDGIESEEDLSSQEEVMDTHDDPVVENTKDTNKTKVPQNISSSRVVVNPGTTDYNDSEMSVLVIETGLDKSKRVDVESLTTNTTSDVAVDKNLKKISTSANSVVDCGTVTAADKNLNSMSEPTVTTVQTNDKVTDKSLPILKKILSDKPSDSNLSIIESIDLCDSENDKFSDDDMSEVELTDDELKSVIKNNLMAEVGFTLNKQKESDSNVEKPTQVCSPKIAVKSIAQISTDAFNNFSNHNENSQIINKEYVPPIQNINSEINNKTSVTGNNTVSEISIRDKDQVPTTIQISKIAVPHHTFVNSKGQRMNCVYVRNQTALPVVINSNQPKNKNVRFMLTSQVKNGPVQLASTAALTNVTKLNVQNKPVLSKPTRVLSVAPKLEKPPILQSNPSRAIHQYTQVQCLDSIVKGLLFKKLKKPYVPLDTSTGVTYNCLECCDKFLLQSSLTHHLARRSVSIRYWCRICKTELEFYNRCVLLKHLRRHNTSLKHIDTTCVTFNPIAKEMVDSGLATTSFEEFTNNSYILQRNSKNEQLPEIASKTLGVDNVVNETQIMSTVSTLSSASKKVTASAGQSKSVCIQNPSSIILNRPISALAPISQATKPMFTAVVPKTPKLSVMQNLQRPAMEQSPFLNKSGPKSVILLCNKLPKSANPKQYSNKHINSVSSNVEEPEFRKLEISLNDNKNNSVINNNEEEEDIDIESVTIESDMSNTDNSIIEKIGSEKSSTNKTKDKKILPGSQKVKRNCSECGVACLNISKHLNGNNRPLNPDLACKVCHLVMATKCALKIHLRIHMKMEPYKCPDCGKDFDSWEEVHAHLKFSCGHLAKCVRYLCVSCKAHFPSVGVLGHHISSTHSRCIFKCKLCPVAFFNSPSLDKHIQTSHPDEMDLRMDYKQCSMCPKKLVPTDKFVEHVQEHTKNNNVLIYGYKCPLCSVVFANKMAFIIHQLKEKKDKEQKEGKKPRSVKSMSTKNVSDSNSELEDEPEIIRKYPEINYNGSAAEKDPLSLEDWECSQEFTVKEKREELCIVCKKNSVVLLPNIDLNDQSLCCKQCVRPLDIDSAVNSSHLQLSNRNVTKTYVSNSQKNHIFNPIKRKRSAQKTIKRSASCDEVKMAHKKARSSVDNLLKDYSPESESSIEFVSETAPIRKKSRKKTNKEKFDAAGQTHIQGQVITSKSPNELVCSKCEFIADTRETFLKHITAHRTDPNTFQCFECGLCFVVLPSLERHLQMHHGIKDVDSYTRKNSSSLPQKVASLEEDVDDNQCRVCNEIFDSGSSLEKHFRTHGMAFMNSLSKSP